MIGKLSAKGREYAGDESGVSTVWALYWTIIFLVMAGFVIDASNAYRYRVVLQVTADSSSLGALMSHREPYYYASYMQTTDEVAADLDEDIRGRAVAQKMAMAIMGEKQNKIVVGPNQIEFGNWDGNTFNTVEDPEDVDAAKVTALRSRANGNELQTLLLNMFGGLDAWDVGAVAIAHFKQSLCPQKEGIMAGNELDIETLSTFSGDLCLHGEQKVNIKVGNDFGSNTTVSYGAETEDYEGGKVCIGGNCDPEKVMDKNIGLTEDNLGAVPGIMPNVPDMFDSFKEAIINTDNVFVAAVADPELLEYVPEALLYYDEDKNGEGLGGYTTPTSVTDLITIEDPLNPGNQVVDRVKFGTPDDPNSTGGDDFQAYLDKDPSEWMYGVNIDDPETARPLRPHTVYEVYGCSGSGKLTFESDELTAVVIATDCRVDFAADAVVSQSTILTTFGDPSFNVPLDPLTQENDYTGSQAFSGSSGTKIGTGTCENPTGASKLIAAGDIDVASGMQVAHSQVLTKGDMHIAAQADAMEGITAWAWGDISLTSQGEWHGCDVYNAADQTVPGMYVLVY